MPKIWGKLGNSGSSAAEYALILALIGLAVALAAGALGSTMSAVLTDFAGRLV